MKIFCPVCEDETDGALIGATADDGYVVEIYKCDICHQKFERIYPPDLPPNTYMRLRKSYLLHTTRKRHVGRLHHRMRVWKTDKSHYHPPEVGVQK